MAFSYLFFDLDGTLLDFEQSEALAFTAAFAGEGFFTDDDMYKKYREISKELWDALEKGQITRDHLVVERFRRLFAHFKWDLDPAYMNDVYIHTLSFSGLLFPDALPLLDALKGKIPMAVVTNGIAKSQRGRIQGAGIDKHFEHFFISEEMGAPKPDPAFFEKALATCGIDNPAEVLIIGDSLSADMKGGVDSGLKTCWYNPGGAPNTLGLPIDYEIKQLGELLPILQKEEA